MAASGWSASRHQMEPSGRLYYQRARAPNSPSDPSQPILKLVRTSSPRYQFWILCVVVFFLILVYGFVFWDTMTRSPRYKVKITDWAEPRRTYDIHLESLRLNNDQNSEEEEEEMLIHTHGTKASRTRTVAIGCAITSRMYRNLTADSLQYRLPLLRTLLPSFCHTASAGYDYHFYVSFDADDSALRRADLLNAIFDHFQKVTRSLCPATANVSLHFVQCSHSHNPAWAQNDAMMEAYLDGSEYYYRVNDDTLMLSPGWTEAYIEALHGFDPPFVGVVGPMHKGGNEVILTYDFVHRTHIDIFGYYYPRLFTDWWADDWITAVYGSERTIKLPGVRLKHTQEAGQRYRVQYDNGELVHYQVAYDRKTLNRYIYSKRDDKPRSILQKANATRVISMSLWGSDPKYTFGAIRNAQLTPVFFPGWTLRVYVEEIRANRPPRFNPTPRRIVDKLAELGAEVVYVNTDEIWTGPMLWRFLVADDMSVDCFIVRDADARLQDRDAAAVADWLATDSPFHCVRDHPSHTAYSVSGGMWGARPKGLRRIIPIPWKNLMMGYRDKYGADMTFLSNLIWRKVQSLAYCHDSYSCTKWNGSHPFPVRRRGTEHVGQVFDAFGYARDIDMKIIRETPSPPECTVRNATYADPNLQSDVIDAEVVNSAQLQQLEEDIEKRKAHQQLEVALKDSLLVKFEGTPSGHRIVASTSNRNNSSGDKAPAPNMDQVASEYLAGPKVQKTAGQCVVWNMDYHIGPIRDIKYTLRSHNNVVFVDQSLASNCHLTNTCATNLKVITKKNGLELTPEVKKAFLEQYEDDPEMNLVTHFLCSYPPAMCQLYVPFGRSLVVYITSRYEQARYTRRQWQAWNDDLDSIARDPRNSIVASNLYDAAYLRYYTGIVSSVIPALCSYVQTSYAPVRPEILVAPIRNPSFSELFRGYLSSLIKSANRSVDLLYIPEAYPQYDFPTIASHAAVIHVPYQVSTYTFCEHYAINIPIFVPSVRLLATWHQKYGVLSELTWNRVRHLLGEPDTVAPSASGANHSMPDPNRLKRADDIAPWIRLADFYQRPHVVYFDSVRDLVNKLVTTDLKRVSDNMKQHNTNIAPLVEQQWSAVFKS